MDESPEIAQQCDLLHRLVDYRGRAQVRKILEVTDDELDALLDGFRPWPDRAWKQFTLVWEPYAALEIIDSMDGVTEGAGHMGDLIDGNDDRGPEPLDSIAQAEPEPVVVDVSAQDERTWRRTRAQLLKARQVMLAALYGKQTRRNEKLAVFRWLLRIECNLIHSFGESLPAFGEDWDPGKRDAEIERRARLSLQAARLQDHMHRGIRGLANAALGRGRIDRTVLRLLLAEIERDTASVMAIKSNPHVLAGGYLSLDWY